MSGSPEICPSVATAAGEEYTLKPPSLFRSFWLAGFESSTHINSRGQRLDMIRGIQHDHQAESDYALLKTVGIRCARDGIRWPLIDHGSRYDFSSLLPMVQAAERQHVQIIWDVFHYGFPDELDLFSPRFIDRFAKFSKAVARVIRDHTGGDLFFIPVNELSFFCWAATRKMIYPYATGRASELKRQMTRATIECCEAIWEVEAQARIVYAEPLIHVVAPRKRPDLAHAAERYNEAQYEALDMLIGRLEPQLGGAEKYLDILGLNFYHSNQWEHPAGRLRWEDTPRDPRWVPFHLLLERAYRRYSRPVFIGETGHFGVGRPRWIQEMAQELYQARMRNIPVQGVCLYPVIDRYDWEDPNHWHNSGLWDLKHQPDGTLTRVLNVDFASEFSAAQNLLASIGCV